MRFSKYSPLAAVIGAAVASPTPTFHKVDRSIAKRATITDACDIGYASTNGGTTGGSGGTTTTVSSLSEFSSAAEADEAYVIVVEGEISGGAKIRVGSDKTIVGNAGASLVGVGLYIKDVSNVIVRNLAISKVVADNGDAIGIQASTNVWVDHCDLSSDRDNGKDFYDGLLDITHAADWVTVSNTYFHDHYKNSLVGHSDSNADEDTGALHVTYANNKWANVGSRCPSVRFGTAHIFNNYYADVETSGVNTRMGAEVLVESTQFENVKKAITSQDSDETGTAAVNDVDLGDSTNDAPTGSAFSVPYQYTLVGSASVKSAVDGAAGNTLSF
ncbi:pectin lyase fold/virulence factor [Ilyonectria robusta]|uniref:pectin lyase fold/virulence factor n=1 Tax=Ilyonectria robusta TaxID=1079257 RepID=UPI001E8D10F1|nr:pectin lyase fold/virulence factor [Ilyonectria robusta]KAH8672484.1 pectin lyase fold/virulence factor [Ilyonectria robusta]